MKDTKKASRMFSIAFIVSNFLYLCFRGTRIVLHEQMIVSNQINEATLQKIVFLDRLVTFMGYVIALVAFLAILYLIEELFHSTLQKDCRILGMTMLVCLLLSLSTMLFLQQPITFIQEHLEFLPYFFVALLIIDMINHIKKRIVRQLQQMES